MTQLNRSCQECGKSKFMRRTLDKTFKLFDERYRICYNCKPVLDSDDGDLNYFAEEKDRSEEE